VRFGNHRPFHGGEDVNSGTIAIAEKLYQLKRKIDSPETPKIERVLIVSKNGDRLMLKDATLEQLQKLSEQEKSSEKWV
jgi:hypothetical protein